MAQGTNHGDVAHKVDAAALNKAVDKLCGSKAALNKVDELVCVQATSKWAVRVELCTQPRVCAAPAWQERYTCT